MSAAAETATAALPDPKLAPSSAKRAVQLAGAVAGVGAVCSAIGAAMDIRRFAYAYLVGFLFAFIVSVGALMFLLILHVTRSGWSVATRRQLEWLSSACAPLVALFIPVAIFASKVYPWMFPENAEDELYKKKAHWLNNPRFFALSAAYLVVFLFLQWYFRRRSLEQDTSKEPVLLAATIQKWSAPAIYLGGAALTFASFDWIMSLEYRWYSTIFGVYIFATMEVATLAAVSLITVALQRKNALGPLATVEHRHDLGKFLFGFVCFWAYIAFAQYFLIWYAEIPEETAYFRHRLAGSWSDMSVLMAVGYFVVPFLILVGRTTKRSTKTLVAMAAWLLFMTWVNVYWMVMPVLDPSGMHLSIADIGGLLLPVGVCGVWVARQAGKTPLWPLQDPHLEETKQLDQP